MTTNQVPAGHSGGGIEAGLAEFAAAVRRQSGGTRSSGDRARREGIKTLEGIVVTVEREHIEMCHHDATGLFELFVEWFGPMSTLWHTLDQPQQERFRDGWLALAEKFSVAREGTCEIRSDYLEVVAVKA